MKFAFIDTYYYAFLDFFYKKYPQVKLESYKKNLQALLDYSFGTSDFYTHNLIKIGHKACDFIVNDEILQRKWASENKILVNKSNLLSQLQTKPFLYRLLGRPQWLQQIVISQIGLYKPEVIYIQDLSILTPKTLQILKDQCKLLVGQIASVLPTMNILSHFDLILTSFPHYVNRLIKKGIKIEYFKIGFEKRLLDRIGNQNRIYDVSFIGSFSPYHMRSTKIFEEAARKIDIHIWGHGLNYLSSNSPFRKYYHGQSWGIDMYKILSQSKIVINRHIDAAENYANNMRLYETTGMGAMLITDMKKNLNELFKTGKEIETYKNADELISKVRYYLSHEDKRQEIAVYGQKRTLEEHSYHQRMKELVKIVNKYIKCIA